MQPHSGHLVVTIVDFGFSLCLSTSIISLGDYRTIPLTEWRPAFRKNLEVPGVLTHFLFNLFSYPLFTLEFLPAFPFLLLVFTVPLTGKVFLLGFPHSVVSLHFLTKFLVGLFVDVDKNRYDSHVITFCLPFLPCTRFRNPCYKSSHVPSLSGGLWFRHLRCR